MGREMCSKVRAVVFHTLGPYLYLLNPRKISAGFMPFFFLIAVAKR